MAVNRLARILSCLLLCGGFCTSVFAAGEPVRLGGKLLDLPDNWTRTYQPPEVLLQVLVLPDSTLSLVDILDGKNELAPLLAEHFASYKYLLQADSLAVNRQLEVILGINQPAPTDSTLSQLEQEELLQEIEAWIKLERESRNQHAPVLQPVTAKITHSPEPYRAGFFFHQRFDESGPLIVNGFQPHNAIFSRAVYYNYLQGLMSRQDGAWSDAWTEQLYPYGVLLSDIEAGLGDYEHRFARGALKKNTLFGVPGCYLGFDFLVQGGSWLEERSSLSILKLLLRVPWGRTTLDLGFADNSSQMSVLTLKPEYWQDGDFPVERNYRTLYAAWKTPWLNLALFNENDTARSEEFLKTLHNDALHLQAWKELACGGLQARAAYEHMFTERNFLLVPDDYADLASLSLNYTTRDLASELLAQLKDFEHYEVAGDIHYRGAILQPGAYFRFRADGAENNTVTGDIYTGANTLPRVDMQEPRNLGLYLSYQMAGAVNWKVALGQRNAAHKTSSATAENFQNVEYASLSATVGQTWGKWKLDWAPAVNWQAASTLYENPELAWQSHLTLARLLPFNNALFAGFSLLGHSPYDTATDPLFTVETSLIADAWAGVRVSDRFEFLVSYKNITDSTIYGVYPLPASLHASLRWFYLN